MRLITAKVPNNWKSLQNESAGILAECGFAVKIEKKMPAARGEVEIDVYAEETVKGRKYAIACECKHWGAKVPQTIIHSFRTVVNDLGATIGYLISSRGFQSGSFQREAGDVGGVSRRVLPGLAGKASQRA
jgi:restriction system protein